MSSAFLACRFLFATIQGGGFALVAAGYFASLRSMVQGSFRGLPFALRAPCSVQTWERGFGSGKSRVHRVWICTGDVGTGGPTVLGKEALCI